MAKKVLYVAIDKLTKEVYKFKQWSECQKLVSKGKYVYKGFSQEELKDVESYIASFKQTMDESQLNLNEKDVPYAYVDGSCLTNGDTCYAYSFGVTIIENNQEIYTNCQKFDDEFVEYNQVMGELKAALDAVSYCVQQGYKKMYVIHDYEGVAFYATGAWVNEDERLENLYVKQMKEYGKQIEIIFVKVKSHVTNKTEINRYNDRADELANMALGR